MSDFAPPPPVPPTGPPPPSGAPYPGAPTPPSGAPYPGGPYSGAPYAGAPSPGAPYAGAPYPGGPGPLNPPPYPYPVQPPVAVQPLRGIASAVRWLILASAVGSLITIGTEALGVIAIARFLDGSVGTGALDAYDAMTTPVVLLSSAVLLAAGICWVIWQYRAASSVPATALRRTPGWHVGSWFIPVVAWWFPVQNVSDLVRASRAAVGSGVIATWWTLWIGGNIAYLVVNRLQFSATTLPGLSAAAVVSIIGELFTIGAAVFAWIIVARITDAIDPVRR